MATRHQRRIARRLLSFLVACVGLLLIVSNALPGIWYELTRSRTLTVSAGTRSLVSGLRQPITLALFVSKLEGPVQPLLQSHAQHVRRMLDELVLAADGKLIFQVLDPLSSPEARARADRDGIEAANLVQGSQPVYLGLAASNSAGMSASIPFLAPDAKSEALLDHDIARLIYELAAPAAGPAHWRYATLDGQAPLIIGHRGAAGLYPEHTIAGYRAAIRDGADCIEPDLVMTKDGVLVDRHDIYLSTTTDVATRPEFATRKRKGPDFGYAEMEDWYVSDFTLAELETLRAIQPFAGRSQAFDRLYTVPTFAAVLDIARENHARSGAPVCVYPEAKWPDYFGSLGFDVGGEILRVLKAKGLATPGSPIYIQSFDPVFLKSMAARTRLPLVLLVMTQCDLDAAMKIDGAPFWNVLGVMHQMLFDWRGKPTSIIHDAHLHHIAVHSWTYRDDAPFWGEDVETSMKRVLVLGLDGLFTDFPFTGYRVVNETKSRI
jgi:glycerophosphoryl diester phosphodiesterase